MKLHEIGLFAKDPKASRLFYHEILGLDVHHEEDGLSVFDGGWPGIEIGACSGYPDRDHVSFIVDDVDELAPALHEKGAKFGGPGEVNLGKREIVLEDPDGLRILIQSPTDASPEWVRKMTK